jgi:hypothetical protein
LEEIGIVTEEHSGIVTEEHSGIVTKEHSENVRGKKVFYTMAFLTPKGPMSVDGFLGSSGRLSQRQKHE